MKTMNTLTKFGAGALGALALTIGAAGIAGAQDDAPAEAAEAVEETHEERRAARGERRAAKKEAIADIVGLSVEELSEARRSGQSLAEIAGDNVDEVVEFLTNNVEERIAARVEAGRLTEEEAADRLANIEERISERIENPEVRERGERRGDRANRGANATPGDQAVDS